MAVNYLSSGRVTYSSFDYDFIVYDDLYTSTPSPETTRNLGKAINRWTDCEESMINNLNLQLEQTKNLKNARGERFNKKMETTAVQIIQGEWRKSNKQ